MIPPEAIMGIATVAIAIGSAFLAISYPRIGAWLSRTLLGDEPSTERPAPVEPCDFDEALKSCGGLSPWESTRRRG